MSERTKILICDDHLLFAQGLENLLIKKGYEITLTHTSQEFLEAVNQSEFDIILIDFHIDNFNGIELVEGLDKKRLTNTRVFLLTAYAESFMDEKAEKANFSGVLIKSLPVEEILNVLNNRTTNTFHSSKGKSLDSFQPTNGNFDPKSTLLTKQEMEVIKETIKGKSTKEIAVDLYISPNTVNTHRRNIYQKLDIKGIGALVGYANRYLKENLR